MMEVLEQAVKELAETGTLSFPARRRLWEAMGPYEERPEDDPVPCSLTPALKKRAELALACAKKVSRIWAAYAGEDKRPQRLIRQVRAYLDGKITAEALDRESGVIDGFMSIVDDEPNDSAPAAALAAWDALVTALHDESLLEPRYADAADDDLDPYDWDAAKNAALAWRDANSDGDPGKRAVREMKFWAWYLEEAARLLEFEGFKFPPKYIKAFQDRQNPPRPVPEEVSLESFTDYLGAGSYLYHVRTLPGIHETPSVYKLTARIYGESGICPICRQETRRFDCIMAFNYLESPLPGAELPLYITQEVPLFHCPDHSHEWCFPPTPRVNPKAALKHYLKEPGRAEALLEQLERRAVNACELLGGSIILNGNNRLLRVIDWVGFPPEQGACWLDKERELYEVDLTRFGPHVYFSRMPYEEFCQRFPEQVRRLEDGSTELTFSDYWANCRFDAAGALERVVVRSRCHIRVKELDRCGETLSRLLVCFLDLTPEQAEEAVRSAEQVLSKEWTLSVLSGLEKREAVTLQAKLAKNGIPCRVCPTPLGEQGD
ncbi:hypothetical protein D1646_11965 [Pseudoflavonifractor sp. 60]|uniref:Imm5 family immunity protein n=1 Tax=Pseudoflavonifractor sp. 60 TaxID=2304576 RepID=UPI0013688643|nr:Imm5 family immunity protein [Pseudoflavonifractor sp. 60]NBI67512.1 hypothetical protein [Pseudoflavonifractor sp. 60]